MSSKAEMTDEVRTRYNELHFVIPTDPQGWWTGEEVDAFIDRWRELGLPELTLHDASGETLMLWTTNLRRAGEMLGLPVRASNGSPWIEIYTGEYEVCIEQADEK